MRVAGFINGRNEAVDALDVSTEVDDAGGGGFIVFEQGTFATVDCTVPRSDSSMLFSIVGTDGKLYLNNDDGEWRYWTNVDGEHAEAPLPGIDGSWTWEEDYTEAFANAASHVVDFLDGVAENRSSGEQARQSLEMIVELYLSHHTGATIDLPLARPLRDVEITSW